MILLSTAEVADHKTGRFEANKMLGQRLARVGNQGTQLLQGLAVVGVQLIENRTPSRVCQCFEYEVHGAR